MKIESFFIECMTSLQISSNEEFGIIDIPDMRDPVTMHPIIPSSCLKEAIKYQLNLDIKVVSPVLILFPMMFNGEIWLFSSKTVINNLQAHFATFHYEKINFERFWAINQFKYNVLINDEQFETATTNLPFVAKNCLENGRTMDLWYEEFVPRQTIFLFSLIHDDSDSMIAQNIENIGTI